MLRISGYDVIFPHNLRLLDVVARLRQWCSHAALRLTRRNTSCKQRTLDGYGHPVGRTSIWRRLLIGRRRVHRARHRITSARRLPILNVLEEGRYHSPSFYRWVCGRLWLGENHCFNIFTLMVPASEQGMESMLTADFPAVGPWTLAPPAPLGIIEWSGQKIEWAERWAGVIEIGMSGERIFRHSRSAHISCP